MEIRIRDTGQVVTDSEFRAMHPDTGFPQVLSPEILDSFGADAVMEGPQAQPTRYQTAYRDGIQEINGKWFTKYSVADMDDAAKAAVDAQQAASQRAERNRRLAETDWRFRTDMNPSQEWINYCQALRNIPSQSGFPWEIDWPTQPE